MRMMMNTALLYFCVFLVSAGCAALNNASPEKDKIAGEEATIETDLVKIYKGMARNDVESELGVTTVIFSDNKGRLVIIYDRVPVSDIKLDSSDQDTLLLIGYSKGEEDPAIVKKKFSITIKFDDDDRVYDFKFRPAIF